MSDNSTIALSDAQATDQLFSLILRFMFEQNAIMTWIHIVIILGGLVVIWMVSRLDPNKLSRTSKMSLFVRDVIFYIESGASSFLTSFGIGFVLFLVGVACEGVNGISSLLVQLLTYMPTMILGMVQLRATLTGVSLVKKHTGL